MTIGFIFWLLMILWVLFGLWQNFQPGPGPSWSPLANTLWLFILFLLLGIQVFGWPIKA